MASTVPGGASPVPASTPEIRIAYDESGRSRSSRVRTGGMITPSSMAILRRSARTRSSRSPLLASTRSTRSGERASSSGSTRISPSSCSGESGAGMSTASVTAAASSSGTGSLTRCAITSTATPTSRNGTLGRPGITQRASAAPPPMRSASLFWLSCSVTLVTHVAGGRRAGHDQTGGHREQQRRHLGDQAVADAQHAELVHRVGRRRGRAGAMPTAKPPTRLISVMMMAATASPLTNLEPPSMAP